MPRRGAAQYQFAQVRGSFPLRWRDVYREAEQEKAPMHHFFRDAFGSATAFIGTACLLSACSNAAVSKAVGNGADGGAAIVVNTSESAVTVDNHTGRPLLNVRVTIDAIDMATPFIRIEPTIDTGVKSDMALTSFRTEDGTLLDPLSVHPRLVRVTARDTLAKTYELTVPWKQ